MVYLDLQAKTPPSESAFYQALGRALVQQPAVKRIESLRRNLLAPPRSHQDFAVLLEQFADYVLLPVFCLDEFEVLLKSGEQFTDIFFDQLRGCMNASQLMFILSSRRPLDVYAGEQNLTSAFFNLGHVVALGEFSEEEAEELVRLPMPGRENLLALGASNQELARQWGGGHPYLLQLAATALFEAQQLGKKTAWAKKQFEAQRCRIQPVSAWKRPLSLKAIMQGYRRSLTGAADDASKWKTIILTFALLLVVGMVGYKLLTGTWELKDLLDVGKLLK
ncbi:MAG: hypothetical protein D3922_13395 [Candidatus Electrothrix sp. AR1]|nr:hypothetical protein [Candidatus Electrothrix sp. AR1]